MLQCRMASEVERLREVVVFVAGNPADDRDVHQFLTVTLARYGLEADLCGFASVKECVYRRSILSQRQVDLQTYAQDMKTIKLGFISFSQQTQGLAPFTSFKRWCSPNVHYKWLFAVLERLWGSFRACLQWLAFDERLLLTTNEDDITSELLDYIEFEQRLRTRPLDGEQYPYPQLRSIISVWLQDFALGEYPPSGKFGPGAVAGMKGRPSFWEKAQACVWDPAVVELFSQHHDCTVDELIPGVPVGFVRGYTDEDLYTNRIIFRPKNALKHRIISAEPTWLSWLQQDLKTTLYDYVERHPKMFTWFSNQEESRRLACLGSVDGAYATFDFSNASDSVSKAQVAELFRDTYVVEPLLAARSRYAKLPRWDLSIELDKFAPMGSATCFVTMDIILLSACELAIRESLGRPGRRGDYVVYGDDVIIRVAAAGTFQHVVDALGFELNSDKSYWLPDTPHFYRESCGIEAYDGVDVTPIRYSRFQEPILRRRIPSDGTWLPSVVDLCNRLLLKGLWNTRSAVLQMLNASLDWASNDTDSSERELARRMRHVWNSLERVDASDFRDGANGPTCVVVPDGTATNYRVRHRWNAMTMQHELRVSEFSVRAVDTYKRAPYCESSQMLSLWFLRAQTELRTSEPRERILASVAGVSRQQWRDIWVVE